jgi:beta-lactamase regulating signal transducer with metallopeptidase domain
MPFAITPEQSLAALRVIIDLALKSAIFLIPLTVGVWLLRRRSASVRSMVWTCAILGLLALAALSVLFPFWRIPLLPDFGDSVEIEAPIPENSEWQNTTRVLSLLGDLKNKELAKNLAERIKDGTVQIVDSGDRRTVVTDLQWPSWVLHIWVGGIAVLLCWFAVGKLVLWRIYRSSRPVDEEEWRSLLKRSMKELDIGRDVRLLRSDRISVAFTLGFRKPAIVLPATGDEWGQGRRRMVMLHELGHVKRADVFMETVAHIVTALYWFNPLVWLAAKRLRIERERACDDIVIGLGTRPSEYATELMQVAADLAAVKVSLAQAAAMSQGGSFKDRLLFILNPRVDRSTRIRRTALVAGLLVALLVVPISVFTLWSDVKGAEVLSVEAAKKLTDNKNLVESLGTPDPLLRAEAAKRLASIEREKIRDIVLEVLKNDDEEARSRAVDMLVDFDEYLVTGIIAAYAKGDNTPSLEYNANADVEMKRINQKKSVQKLVNSIGYEMLNKGSVDEAIELFRLNVQAFPQSSNTYDSLAEAYAKKGETKPAVEYYQKSLQLNPYNENAIKMLQQLSGATPSKKSKP